ncbi:MAG: type II toxin-antitoxin system RelE/ParE family toxin [Pseudomonadota bacterium]
MKQHKLTQAADADIDRLYEWGIDTFGVEQADAYLSKLERAFETIALNPGIGRVREEFGSDIRVYVVQVHVVLYTMTGDGGVLIVRVRPAREDWLGSP